MWIDCWLIMWMYAWTVWWIKKSSTLLNTFFFLFSIMIDDTDDIWLFVLIYVGNALLIVGKGGNSLSYIYFVFIWLSSSHGDMFIFVTPVLSFSSSESNSYLSCSSGSSLSVSLLLWYILTILFWLLFFSLDFFPNLLDLLERCFLTSDLCLSG